jgi:predicted nucleic acid-binding protein
MCHRGACVARARLRVEPLLAAIAFTRRLTLVTANMKDFRTFEGLETIDWT